MASPRKELRLVREEDAAAFVVDVAVMLKLAGRDPVITAENERWLHRADAGQVRRRDRTQGGE
jgi:hypothetical protein